MLACGGLNGSTQHQIETRAQGYQRLRALQDQLSSVRPQKTKTAGKLAHPGGQSAKLSVL